MKNRQFLCYIFNNHDFEQHTLLHTFSEIRSYYQSNLPFITSQTLHHSDTAPSVIEQNVTDVTAQQEWETEWNQAGLASRLSEQVL